VSAGEAAALAEYREQQAAGTLVTVPQAAGTLVTVPQAEVRRRFGLGAE
jgi:hypothetical protein